MNISHKFFQKKTAVSDKNGWDTSTECFFLTLGLSPHPPDDIYRTWLTKSCTLTLGE